MAKKMSQDLKEYLEMQKGMQAAAEKVSSSLGGALEHYKDMRKLAASIAHIEGEIVRLKAEQKKIEDEQVKNGGYISANDQAKLDALKEQIAYQKQDLDLYKKKGAALASQLNTSNLLIGAGKSIYKVGKDNLKWFIEQDKALKMSALSMSVLKNNAGGFNKTIEKAALRTNYLGSTVADLAKMQANYSESLGRMVVLSEGGLNAMAEIAQGTTLGAEGAAQMVASMDLFGISAEGARDRVEETLDFAHKMGVNASAVMKGMDKNLKLAQGYNFRKGVMGVTMMAARAEKFKMSIESAASFADKLITPEGAVETAAQLQVLGGAWSQMADPFKLMYDARNDIEALHKSMIEATAGTAQFNKETGEFDIVGLEMHRLREVAKVTGQDYKELAESAKQFAKFAKVGGQIRGTVDKETKEFIESVAQLDSEGNAFVMDIGGNKQYLKDVQGSIFKLQAQEKQSLIQRAETSKTFDEQWGNIVNTFKTALLPMLQGVFDVLSGAMTKFTNWAKNTDLFEKMQEIGRDIGEAVVTVGKFIAKNPIKTLIIALASWGALKAATWFMNGRMLAMGFNTSAMVRGGGMGGGMGSGMGGAGGGRSGGKFGMGWQKSQSGLVKGDNGVWQNQTIKGGLKNSWGGNSGMRGMGVGMGLGMLGAGMYSAQSDMDPNSAGSKAMGIGGGIASGAGMGAMFGPWGAAIGGILGGVYGAITELTKDREQSYLTGNLSTGEYNNDFDRFDDFIAMPGKGAQPFKANKKDTIIGMKPNGPIDNAMGSSQTQSSVKHVFDEIKINGKIELAGSNGQTLDNDLLKNNPHIARELSRIIQIEIRKGTSGGKVNNG